MVTFLADHIFLPFFILKLNQAAIYFAVIVVDVTDIVSESFILFHVSKFQPKGHIICGTHPSARLCSAGERSHFGGSEILSKQPNTLS